jgi:hypothetical protein
MAKKTIDADAVEGMDANGDGHISAEEMAMHLEFKRKEMEDADAQNDMVCFIWYVTIPICNRVNIVFRLR